MSNNAQTGKITHRTALYNTLITGLIATCAAVAINATLIILHVYFREQIVDTTYARIFDDTIKFIYNDYRLITIFILGLCAPFIARIYPHDPILRRVSWISATALLILPHITFFVYFNIVGPDVLPDPAIVWHLLYIVPLILLYLFLSVCAFGETLYIERNPHALATWDGWDLRNIPTLSLFAYYCFIASHILIPLLFFMLRALFMSR